MKKTRTDLFTWLKCSSRKTKKTTLEGRAKALRFNQTRAERAFARLCREAWPDITIRQQYAIGRYIVDFYFPDQALIVEIDGGGHSDSLSDKKRDNFMRKQGFKVIRFWNNEVLQNKEGVYIKTNEYLR